MALSNLQDLRQHFEAGEEVLVQKRQYSGVVSGVRIATVVRKELSFATVKFPDNSVQKVPYKRLQKMRPPAPIADDKSPLLRAVPNAFCNVDRSEPPTEPTPTAPPRSDSEIAAWLDMGEQLLDQLHGKERSLRKESEFFAAQAQELTDQADAKVLEADELHKQIEIFDQFRKMASHAAAAAS